MEMNIARSWIRIRGENKIVGSEVGKNLRGEWAVQRLINLSRKNNIEEEVMTLKGLKSFHELATGNFEVIGRHVKRLIHPRGLELKDKLCAEQELQNSRLNIQHRARKVLI